MEMVVVGMEEEEGENANTDPELVERYSVRGAGATRGQTKVNKVRTLWAHLRHWLKSLKPRNFTGETSNDSLIVRDQRSMMTRSHLLTP